MKRLFAPLLLAATLGAAAASVVAVLVGGSTLHSRRAHDHSFEPWLVFGHSPRGLRDGADGHPDLPARLQGRRLDQGRHLRRRGRGHGDRAQQRRADPHQRSRGRGSDEPHGRGRGKSSKVDPTGEAGGRRSQQDLALIRVDPSGLGLNPLNARELELAPGRRPRVRDRQPLRPRRDVHARNRLRARTAK